MKAISLVTLLAALSTPAYAQVFGSLANFDVVNDTGKVAHGFEIDIRNIHRPQITSIFGDASRWPNMERYGSPTVTEYNDANGYGVKITYRASFSGGAWASGTPSGTLPVNPADSCWPLGAPNYGPLYPCDHFGVSTSVSTPNVNYSWLVEVPGNAGSLTPVLATVPNPVWSVTPVPPVNNVPQPPKVNVLIAAPKPYLYEFGEPRWVKVTATGTLRDVAVEDLVAENDVIKKARSQTQLEWQLLQVDSGNPGSGQIDLTGVALDPGATGVVYRFEFYKYTGQRDPATNEALPGPNGDTPGANGPSPGDLGAFIVAQNAGINFDGAVPAAPPLPIAPTLNATIAGAVVGSPYNQAINATPGNPADALTFTVTGLPAGLYFDNATSAIVGTPNEVGTFTLFITVTDTANGLSTSGTTHLQVADAPIVFNPTLAQATVGATYSQALSITGGYGAITYGVYGTLPPGLSLVGNTIQGIPTTTGSYPVTLTATDSLGYSQVANVNLTVVTGNAACSGSHEVVSSVNKFWLDIGGGMANGGKSVRYAAPAGTTFVAPVKGFKFGELVSYDGVMDAAGFCTASTMTVERGLGLNRVAFPVLFTGKTYPSISIAPVGGVAPYSISVGGLPNGLTFDGKAISGIPAPGTEGVWTLVVSVSDAIGETVNTNLSLTITSPPVIVTGPATLPAGVYGAPYAATVAATGGLGRLRWTATGLPTGLWMHPSGNISGVPRASGSFPVSFTVSDWASQASTVTGTIEIAKPAVTITSVDIPTSSEVGAIWTGTEVATGGFGTLVWKATGLPPGVTMSWKGVVAGSPRAVGDFNVVLTVTDKLGTSATVSRNVTVAASCVIPRGGRVAPGSSGVIQSIQGDMVTYRMANAAGTLVTVKVPNCATVQWNGGVNAFAVGQMFRWAGYTSLDTGNVAQSVTVN